MTRNIMKRVNRATQHLACATLLAVMTGALPVSAQTMEEARTAFRRGDHARAAIGFRNHAARGDAQAQLILGDMYAKGEGVPEDDTEAVRWYRLAAEQGDVSAQLSLGFMYDKGEGVAEDDAEAMRWFRLAAEQGYAPAQSAVGFMYVHGEGVPEDAVTAYAWFSIAAAQGNPSAHSRKEHMTGLMARAQIAEAQKRSGVYWTSYVVPFQ